jgi:hypothetical protein
MSRSDAVVPLESTTLEGDSLANLEQRAASVVDLADYVGGLCGDIVKP